MCGYYVWMSCGRCHPKPALLTLTITTKKQLLKSSSHSCVSLSASAERTSLSRHTHTHAVQKAHSQNCHTKTERRERKGARRRDFNEVL